MVATAPPPYSVPQPSRGSGAAKTALLGVIAGVAVFALVAVAGGGYIVLRSRSHAASDTAAQAAQNTSTAKSAATESAAPALETQIVLVEPKSGVTLLVDGVVQPVGQLTLSRPAAGATKTLTARAAGYKDHEYKLEASSSSIEVSLDKDTGEAEADKTAPEPARPSEAAKAAPSPKPAEAAKPSEATKPDKPAEKPAPTAKPKPPKPDIPDNPF